MHSDYERSPIPNGSRLRTIADLWRYGLDAIAGVQTVDAKEATQRDINLGRSAMTEFVVVCRQVVKDLTSIQSKMKLAPAPDAAAAPAAKAATSTEAEVFKYVGHAVKVEPITDSKELAQADMSTPQVIATAAYPAAKQVMDGEEVKNASAIFFAKFEKSTARPTDGRGHKRIGGAMATRIAECVKQVSPAELYSTVKPDDQGACVPMEAYFVAVQSERSHPGVTDFACFANIRYSMVAARKIVAVPFTKLVAPATTHMNMRPEG